jgi:hypothetical protein
MFSQTVSVPESAPLALAALLAASCTVPAAMAQPAETWRPQLVALDESGNRNIPNYRLDAGHTAMGRFQITTTNWLHYAPLLGIDVSLYPNAMSASEQLQGQVAGKMYAETGYMPWAPYNSRLRRDLNSARVVSASSNTVSPRAQTQADPRGGDIPPGSGAKPTDWNVFPDDQPSQQTIDQSGDYHAQD